MPILILLSLLAKFLAFISTSLKIGSGTALPGFLVEKYFLFVLKSVGDQFEEIVMISGTNGKTTTRAILVDIYEKNNVKVCTNRGGANILRGVASSLLLDINFLGKGRSSVAILEVEEASLPTLCKYIKPDTLILTNIFRDQLDAYGEIDKTIGFFKDTLNLLDPQDTQIFINSDDNKLLTILENFNGNVYGFGLDIEIKDRPKFESEDRPIVDLQETYQAKNITSDSFEIRLSKSIQIKVKTKLSGFYNLYNVLAAFLVGYKKFGQDAIIPIAEFTPVFGRGEKIVIENSQVELILIKNPAGFEQVLKLISTKYKSKEINLIILINDNIADGKDVSWLWDVDLESFVNTNTNLKFITGGTRGLDMLLRLEYACADVDLKYNYKSMEDILSKISFAKNQYVVLCTYTALLQFRGFLEKKSKLRKISDVGN